VDLWQELEARVQGPDEPTIDYFYSKFGLCRLLDLPFADTWEYVLEELRSQSLTDWVYGRMHSDRDELLSDIRDWERIRAKRKEKFEAVSTASSKPRHVRQKSTMGPVSTKPTYAVPAAMPKATTSAPAKPLTSKAESKTEASKELLTFYCYNCRGAGHISRDCRNPRRPVKCSNCGSNQSTRGRCPDGDTDRTDTASVADQAYRVDAATSANTNNPFMKTVLINGRPVVGLINFGSSAVQIRSSIARECNIAVRDTVCPLYTVGNANRPGATTIGEGDADITIDDVLGADHTLKVVPDNSIPVDVLVGRGSTCCTSTTSNKPVKLCSNRTVV